MVEVSGTVVTTMLLYLAGMIGVGVWTYRRTQGLGDFVLGGRSLGSVPSALSAQASDMSGWLLLGLPGAIYVSGLGASWIGIGLLAGTYLNWKFVASRLRTATEAAGDSVTLSAYFENRFEDRTRLLRVTSALVTVVFFAIYVSSGLVAGGLLFGQVFGFDPTTAVIVSAVVIVVYTLLGGYLAVSYTDAVQGLLMLGALIVVPLVAVAADGGFGTMTSSVRGESPDLLRLFGEAGFDGGGWATGGALGLVAIVSGLAWGLGYFGQPHILARFMGIRSASMVPVARRIGTSWVAICLGGAILVGIAGIAYFDQPLADPETVFLALITDTLTPWIAAILLTAVLAAVMSTADSQLLVSSAALTEDLYRALFAKDAPERTLLWVGRATTVGVAVVATALALRGGTVLDLVGYAWAGFGAAFGPVIILSLYWRGITALGALAGMVTGAATVVLWRNLTDGALYEIVPGIILATVAIIVVSRFTPTPVRDWAEVHAEAERPLVTG
ncbi:sodium/proline symporter PutP [Nitriliruptor alkaliphilus]|uniref:sodium/proline symporter PutP n=1 Tax=Nitriliruptor alkaliphilus TaxID=427918 RepID=UPI000697DECF|nr:sodium/proline symporter PutP [Nitriliruptor alkaliphilus]